MPLGSIALQSFHDASAVDLEGFSPSDSRYESEAGCQELCQSIADCKGYSWRSGGKLTHAHYHKCFLISRIGGGNVVKHDWFTSALCLPRALITPTNGAGACTAHTDPYNEMQVATCGCNSSVLTQGSTFCLNGHTFTVGRSWDTIHCGGATVELDSPVNFTWSSGDNITIGSCQNRKLSSASSSNLRGSASNSTTKARQLESCTFGIKGIPQSYGEPQNFEWSGPCDTTFSMAQETCKDNHDLDTSVLKTSTGETLGHLSCANQVWEIV